ncbi:MAG: hypothetical protein V1696_03790 [Candidatus Jorgensenbacteria bacterium]
MANTRKEIKISWYTRLLLKLWPRAAITFLARQQGIKNSPFGPLHDIFSGVERVDIVPYQPGSRGFMIILDRHTALYFNQNGNHFAYDGFEVGEYSGGDVTIFDNLPR